MDIINYNMTSFITVKRSSALILESFKTNERVGYSYIYKGLKYDNTWHTYSDAAGQL